MFYVSPILVFLIIVRNCPILKSFWTRPIVRIDRIAGVIWFHHICSFVRVCLQESGWYSTYAFDKCTTIDVMSRLRKIYACIFTAHEIQFAWFCVQGRVCIDKGEAICATVITVGSSKLLLVLSNDDILNKMKDKRKI